MKKIILLLLLSTTAVFGQNLKPGSGVGVFAQVPPTILDYLGNTKVFIEAKYAQDAQYVGAIESRLNKDVYTVFGSEAEADWKIVFYTRNTQVIPMKQRSEAKTSKDKAGNEVRTYTYFAESNERYEVHFELISKTGEIIRRLDETETAQYAKSSTTSAKNAVDMYNNDRLKNNEDKIRVMVGALFLKLEDQYFIAKHKVSLHPMEVKSRKFDYADLNEAATLLETWFNSNPTDLSDANVLKAIQIYEQALTEYEPETKKSRVNDEIAAVCHYALACINFTVKDYRKANEHILKSESLDKRIHFSQETLKMKCELLRTRKVYSM